jgi:hypothetical protein
MAYPQTSDHLPVIQPPRSEWWRQKLAAQRRHIAENRMRYSAVFGAIVIIVAAIFLVPMLFG